MAALPLLTPSLRLRHFVPDDAPALLRLNGEPTTSRWLPSHVYADLAEAEARTAYLVACYAEPGDPREGPYVLGVEHRQTGQLLGHVGFSPLDDEVEVSYAIAEAARGHGHGALALERACAWAADSFGLPGFIALTAAANEPSRRTLQRAGFVHHRDEDMRFQGSEVHVARYAWHAAGGPAPRRSPDP